MKEIGDSVGWQWLLSCKKCTKYNQLQFGYNINILQIHYINDDDDDNDKTKSITDFSTKFNLPSIINYKWNWNHLKYIISKIKRSKPDTLFFTNNIGDIGFGVNAPICEFNSETADNRLCCIYSICN